MDKVAKQQVKDALIAQAEAELRTSRADVAEHDSAAQLDQDVTDSVDALSQSDEAGDLGGLLDDVHDRQKANLTRIENLDFGVKDAVAPGALVGFDARAPCATSTRTRATSATRTRSPTWTSGCARSPTPRTG